MDLFSGALEQISLPSARPGTGAFWHNGISVLERHTHKGRVSYVPHETADEVTK